MNDKTSYIAQMEGMWSQCQGCMLCHTRTNVVFGYGNLDAQIMVIGEAPGELEDERGVPFVGSAGKLLDQLLASVSDHPRLIEMNNEGYFPPGETRDILSNYIYYTNVVACRPPDNRNPTPEEIKACSSRLYALIYEVDPVLIISAGRIPTEILTGSKVTITQKRGQIFDIQIPGKCGYVTYPLMAVLHPSYLLRLNDFMQEDGMGEKTYLDFLAAFTLVDDFNWTNFGIPHTQDRPDFPKGKERWK